ncbi:MULTISPECIES: alpha/beta fold hydrolase [unclassified Herbaspirillum]|uniref:alpha/beta fold hydrolase n=1 Tax=unclassified Herbaspirillum TaxID=2624150 RepID=UPI00116F98E6|nr:MULTISPECIES: alpha/beta fold hydrolase [unclassified Herbaspirillum]MBB5391505.1 pimeloyl-ACP methyl ester carboxylesterase [Herbaspirillum sp. SJZ102]TQK12811.1 pimeloyl-ACP methyl ester carboxylesterase [Herbaspirillum sp. SJZ130]TQK14815.1 pimeloyl-ACP methyl ester carboxylesterase [Herbaspirillum sp. SJZ106]TWC71066.1 pimeloyl-ACP methyl ester carboxylesterase [Herbaspirillum sp. SJZ099]
MTTVTHHFADLDDVSLHYLTAGSGFPVVLLHGIPQTSYEWRYVIPHLAKDYRVIAPDLRGLGDSSRPASGYDKKTVSNDVWRLLESLGIDSFHLVGHDWGGPTAFSLAAQHRDAVKKLAILDVAIPGDGADFSQGGRRWHHALFRTPDLPEALFQDRERLIIDWFFDNYGHRPNCIGDEDRKEYMRTYAKPGAMRAMYSFYRALPQDAADNRLMLQRDGKLKMPVLALGGAKGFGRAMETMESLQRVAEDVRGGLVPDSGHWVTEEQPEFIARELLKFFGEK